MTKDFSVLILLMMGAAVCIPMLLMAAIAFCTGISPYGAPAPKIHESEIQKQALADMQRDKQ